jgi:NhaP-type Na+/H+ or K+/H+ antiporter
VAASFLILLLLVIASSWIAQGLLIPDAVAWCLAGFGVAFVPGFPSIQFDAQIALFVFLPPLVYASRGPYTQSVVASNS